MITREQAIAVSPEDKENYRKNLAVPHRNQNTVLAQVQSLMEPDAGLTIVLVVGPPGVGKSSLGRILLRNLLQDYAYLIQEDPAIIPAVLVEVDSPDKKYEIDISLFFARICTALLSPSVLDGFGMPQDLQTPTDHVHKSRILLERAIDGRKLHHLILDEVIHFLHSSTPPIHYGNLLKSLSNRSSFNLALLGPYGSEELVPASGQLARRIAVVEYPRYKDCDQDFRQYATFIKSVAAVMPYRFEIDLENDIEYLFDGNFGIPGNSVDVIFKSARLCSKDKIPRWNRTHLLKSMPSLKAQRVIAKETLRGEEQIQPYLQTEFIKAYATEADIRSELEKEQNERHKLNR
ncbi:ATP-binding protein [Paraburkholderia sp. 35.1]|uniref:ATP-binding protein n=1 Tax=Paraburkholderia sp. 35.1 TaxID=2991058 RepID=UPI003D23184E